LRPLQRKVIKLSPVTKVLTIDGASGTGKTTVCLLLAERLNYRLLLSGLLYRMVAYFANEQNAIDFISSLDASALEMKSIDGLPALIYQGRNYYQELMQPKIAELASVIAVNPDVRSALLSLQREFRIGLGLIAEGRDMGSVVFPDASLKVYLNASLAARAHRRAKQLQLAGKNISIDELLSKMSARDERDSSRLVSPMVCPDDAFIVDTSELTIDEVVQKIVNKLHVVE